MALAMARPIKLKSSPHHHYKKRVPLDVLPKARGQVIVVPVGDSTIRVTVGEHIKFSLRTSDRGEAKTRHRTADEHVSRWFEVLRTGVTTLTHGRPGG